MLILSILYLLLPGVQFYFFVSGQFGLALLDQINFGASIFALHWILANVVISAKIPFLQKHIPYDARIRFHIFSTAGIVAAVLFHSVYKFALGFDINPVTWILMIVIVMTVASALLWIPIPGFQTLRTWFLVRVKKGADMSYDRSKSLHKIFILLLGGLLLLHITGAGLFSGVNRFSALLYGITYIGSFGLYIISRSSLFKVNSEVIDVIENKDILMIRLKPERQFRYKSGQFTFLETENSSAAKEEHPFSFLSHSHNGKGTEEVSLAVRRVGDFTKDLSNLKPGDHVRLRGAFGHFRPGNEKALCFIASGIGTVPVLSIFKELHYTGDSRRMDLFLAVNDKNELPEREMILEMASKMKNVRIHFMVYTEDGLRFSEEFFREKLPDHINLSYYLCSSPGVRNVVVEALKNMGIKKSSIHFEAFSFG